MTVALPRAVHELRAHPGGTAIRQAGHRHRADRKRPLAVQSHHLELAKRVREGIRDAGGMPWSSRCTRSENCRRPTAALDRNLAYLGLVEILHGYPIDAVVLTTGCDKTTPAGSWRQPPSISRRSCCPGDRCSTAGRGRAGRLGHRDLAREQFAAGEINEEEFWDSYVRLPSLGHCNTMGTASTMNAVAEALGHVPARLRGHPGRLSRTRPDGLRDRTRSSRWRTRTSGPRSILTREAFLNAIALPQRSAARPTRSRTWSPWRGMPGSR